MKIIKNAVDETTTEEAARKSGFTLLEVMISLMIFGLLITYVFQFMRHEIAQYNTVINQNNLEQKTRIAMMEILDELRVAKYEQYYLGTNPGTDSGSNRGIYNYDEATNRFKAIINIRPDPAALAEAATIQETVSAMPYVWKNTIYWDPNTKKLIFLDLESDPSQPKSYLIADEIYSIDMQPVPDGATHFVKIDIKAGDPSSNNHYELFTMVRLH